MQEKSQEKRKLFNKQMKYCHCLLIIEKNSTTMFYILMLKLLNLFFTFVVEIQNSKIYWLKKVFHFCLENLFIFVLLKVQKHIEKCSLLKINLCNGMEWICEVFMNRDSDFFFFLVCSLWNLFQRVSNNNQQQTSCDSYLFHMMFHGKLDLKFNFFFTLI